jgi:hypothetical protein
VRLFRFIFFAQDHLLPDPKIPYSRAVARPKYQAWRPRVLNQEKTGRSEVAA